MKLREIIGTKEYKRSLEKLQRELTQPQRTPAETEEFLYGETYFTRFELREILSKFSAYGDMLSSQELLQVIIQSADADQANNFQAYEKLHQLVQQLLVATTFTHDSCNTVNFIRCLSTLSRGSRDERLQLVFRLCDASKDGIVERSEFLQIGNLIQDFVTSFPLSFKLFSNPRPQVPPSSTSRANEVMENEDVVQAFASDESPIPIDDNDDNNNDDDNNNNNNTRHDEQFINWQFHNFASPEDASQLIFGGPGDKHHAEKLNMKHFIERAKVDPDAHRCFGLFDFFYQVFVLPVDKLSRNHGPTDSQGNFTGINHNGQLHMLTKYSHQYVDHYVHIRDKCAVFTSTKDGQIKDVIPLNNAYVTIRQPHPKNIVRNSGHKIHTVAHNHVPRKTSINTNSGSYCPHLALDHGAVALQIRLNQRAYKRVILVAPNMQEAQLWMEALRSNAKGGYAFGTMSPWRENVNPQWFVNGKDYFSAIADGIAAAKNEIFISDWWLVPSIYLKRSTPLDDNYRLDNMLKAAAQRGVIVYVLIWDESNLLNLGSRIAQSILRKLHDHIYVIRHPPQVPVVFSHHQKITVIDQELAFLGGIDLCTGRYDDHNFCVLDPERCTHPDDDYVNACLHTSSRYHIHSRIEILDREHYPRLPWHDIGISVDGDAARDVSLNFIQRWNFSRKQWAPLKGTYQKYNHYPLITPKPAINNNTQNEYNTQNNSSSGALVLRSIGPWSAGQEFEDSIYRVYIMLIMSACHYIYIQNQYFISSTYATQPRNKIALAIVKRIGIAIRANETFKVFVLLPVHTEGYLYEPANIKLVEWTYKTIKAICDALHNEFPGLDISQYITFNALRSWAVRNDHLFTEQVYIHAKLLIVDDKAAVIGSCNINDRSMLGNRDSEIAVVTGDRVPSPSRMNGISFGASKFALSLRMKLWQCHLGIQPGTWEEAVIQDPVCADSWNIWHQTALKNTSIFSRVFGTHIPEECTSLAQLKRPNLVTATPSNILELREVKGFLIKYPFFMLNQEFSGNDNVPSNLFGKIYL